MTQPPNQWESPGEPRPPQQPPPDQWQPAPPQPGQWQPPAQPPHGHPPASPGQWGQPQGQPGQWGQPQGQPDQWGQPQAQPGAWQQPGQWPQPPQQPWQPSAPQQPWQPAPSQVQGEQASWDQLGPVQGGAHGYSPAPKRRRTPLIIAAVAAVVLAGGGAATYAAVADQGSPASGGSSTPQAAVTSIVADLNKSDVLGVLDHLPPAERAALVNPLKDSLDQQKRLHVLKPNTNLSKVSGTKIDAENLTFASGTDTVNDHVQVVKLTGGTISVNSDLAEVPFTDEFLKVAFPHGLPPQSTHNGTVDIAKFIADRNHGKPIRIAAEKVDGKWYPSILYTIADNAAQDAGVDNLGQPIPAKGAGSPQDAVRQAIVAASKQDLERLIELSSPQEMRVLHDYGNVILRHAPQPSTPPFTITKLDLATKAISGGATRVTLRSVTFETGGEQGTVAIDGNCVKVSATGRSEKFCAAAAVEQIAKATGRQLTAEQQAAFEHLFAGLSNIGLDVTETGGSWYVNPMRSMFDLGTSMLSGLQGNDLLTLLAMIPNR